MGKFQEDIAEQVRRLAEKALGSTFWIQVPVRSGAITKAHVDITQTSTEGDLAIEDVVMKVHPTDGLNATGGINASTTFRLLSTNALGTAAIFADVLTNLVTGRTVDLVTARGRANNNVANDAPNTPTVLESGKKLQVAMLGNAGVGVGTVTVCIKFRRLSTDADIIAKSIVA